MSNLELAKRAYRCPGWRWMQGIVLEGGDVVLSVNSEESWSCVKTSYSTGDYALLGHACPDFTAPATLGCLHAMVKQATGCAYSWDVSADFLIAALEEAK